MPWNWIQTLIKWGTDLFFSIENSQINRKSWNQILSNIFKEKCFIEKNILWEHQIKEGWFKGAKYTWNYCYTLTRIPENGYQSGLSKESLYILVAQNAAKQPKFEANGAKKCSF